MGVGSVGLPSFIIIQCTECTKIERVQCKDFVTVKSRMMLDNLSSVGTFESTHELISYPPYWYSYTVDLEIFMLRTFRTINFRRNDPLPC